MDEISREPIKSTNGFLNLTAVKKKKIQVWQCPGMWITGVKEQNFMDFEEYSVVYDPEVSDIAIV